MESTSEDHEADSVDNVSGLSLDMIDADYEPKSNLFHLSEVRLVDLLANDGDVEHEASLFDDYTAGEESGEKSKNIDNSEDYQSMIQRDNYSDHGGKKDDDVDLQMAQKPFQAPPPSALSIFSQKFTTDADIEDVYEDIGEGRSSSSDIYKDFKIFEEIPWESSKRITETRTTKRRTQFIDRNASTLERRLKMIGRFKEIFEERKFIKMKNTYLNRKCCQYYEKSTTDGPFESLEGALPVYSDARYQNILEDFMVVQDHYESYKPILENEIKKLTDSYDILRRIFNATFEEYMHREWEIITNFIEDKPGKLHHKFHILTKKQKTKLGKLAKFRVTYLELNHHLASINTNLRTLNDMGEGRTLMDYELLTMAHDTLLDKMDERDEELHKLKEECTHYIASVSHMKESSDVLIYDMLSATLASNEITERKKEARALLAVGRTKRDDLRKTITSSTYRHVARIIENPSLLRKMLDDTRVLELLKLRVNKLSHDPISIDADHVFMSAKKSIIRPLWKKF